MGFNTTILVRNDALKDIARDRDFGSKLASAIAETSTTNKAVEISSGGHSNAATVIETHHADYTAIVAIGGNTGSVLETR